MSPAILLAFLALSGCQTDGIQADPSAPASWSQGAAPSVMDPTTDQVDGHACAYAAQEWTARAAELLADRWVDIGSIDLGGVSIDSPQALYALFDEMGIESFDAQRATLELNLALNNAGVYGMYADLANAGLIQGQMAGYTAKQLASLASYDRSDTVLSGLSAFNEGFAGCPEDWYLTCSTDLDFDGIPSEEDCDDLNPDVGTLLYQDDLGTDDGFFQTTPQLDDEWSWSGSSVYSTQGGQQAMLGQEQDWDDYVVYARLSAKGTMPGCGFECEESCGDYVPEDCYTDWQALGLGILSAEITGDGIATFYNSGDYDICFEGFLMWDDADSQGFTIGEEILDSDAYRVPAGGSLQVYYGSWTTANGYYEPYLGEGPFWCYQAGTNLETGQVYRSVGALLPSDMQSLVADDSDEDSDGIEDHVDWAGSSGVQSQYNIWEYQEDHAAVVVGKMARSTDEGTVHVTLTAQNRGALEASAILTDTVPADWALVSFSDEPDTNVSNPDGTQTLTWDLNLDGCTESCASFDERIITYDIDYNLNADLDIVELEAASIAYFDGDGDEISYSMPAAAFNYDDNEDGLVLCGDTDRWRAGVLVRASLDGDQDEGYHGYRCALSSNAPEDCYPEGHFLQIAEFMDAPEDDISTECVDDCPENTTFDQLARVNHAGAIDLKSGDSALLDFWIVGDAMMCQASFVSGADYVQATASDSSFTEGTTGFSTLNMFGDFDDIRVCEAYALP